MKLSANKYLQLKERDTEDSSKISDKVCGRAIADIEKSVCWVVGGDDEFSIPHVRLKTVLRQQCEGSK